MKRPIAYSSLTRRDMLAAVEWYERQQRGLGLDFLDRVEETLAAIAERPGSFPIVVKDMHRARVRKFPYGVFFHITPTEIKVDGVIDLRRDPRTWEERA